MPRTRTNKRWIEERLVANNLQKKDLAVALGITQPRVTDLLKGERRLQIPEAMRLSVLFRVPLPEVYKAFGLKDIKQGYSKLVISGYIDATNGALIVARSGMVGEPLEEVDGPFPGYEGAAARIRGASMSPRYRDGEIICFRQDGHDISFLVGQEVVTELEDGRILLKTLHKGDGSDLYTLTSLNPDDGPIVNVAVKWAAPVDFHIPRKL